MIAWNLSELSSQEIPRALQKLSREQAFWAINLFGWAGYGFFLALSSLLWPFDTVFKTLYSLMATLSGLLISLALRFRLRSAWQRPAMPRYLIALLWVSVAAALWAAIKMASHYQFKRMLDLPIRETYEYAEAVLWYTYSFFIYLSWTALYFSIRFYELYRQEQQRVLLATSMAQQAQLKMLRYQLNPHFLFNTLNAISTLILDNDPQTANRMVIQLSSFLRYSLQNDPMQRVTLKEEVSTMQRYLEIEKTRFGDRLTLHTVLTPEAEQALLPSLLLQPLIENSIKYAVSAQEQGATLRIEARADEGSLLIQVSDTGPGLPWSGSLPGDFGGVGLRNLVQRLRGLYGHRSEVHFSNDVPQGLRVLIRLPLELPPPSPDPRRVEGYAGIEARPS